MEIFNVLCTYLYCTNNPLTPLTYIQSAQDFVPKISICYKYRTFYESQNQSLEGIEFSQKGPERYENSRRRQASLKNPKYE